MKAYLAGVAEPDTWDDLVEELETTKKLSRRAIARRLRGTHEPMPYEIRLYLADCLDPRVTLAPRDETSKQSFKKHTDHTIHIKRETLRKIFIPILKRYTRYVKHLRPDSTDITAQFIELFAQKHGIGERELRKILKH